jgi:hypothetical protein
MRIRNTAFRLAGSILGILKSFCSLWKARVYFCIPEDLSYKVRIGTGVPFNTKNSGIIRLHPQFWSVIPD